MIAKLIHALHLQIKPARRTIAGATTLVVSLTALSVMLRGVRTGAGNARLQFLLWILVALAYSFHEEPTEYMKENHTKVTEPLPANMEAVKTHLVEPTRRDLL